MLFNYDKFKQRDETYFHPELLQHEKVNVQQLSKWKDNNKKAKASIEKAHDELIKYQILTQEQYEAIVKELGMLTSSINGTVVLNTLVKDYHDVKDGNSQRQPSGNNKKEESPKKVINISDNQLPFGNDDEAPHRVSPSERRRIMRERRLRKPLSSGNKERIKHDVAVRQGGNSFGIEDFREKLQVDQNTNHYTLGANTHRLSYNNDYFKFIKAGWSVRYRNFYSDDQIRNQEVMNLKDRDVVYLLMMQDLLHEVANNGLMMSDLLNLGDAFFSKPKQNRSFLDHLKDDDRRWSMVQRAIFEGMCEEQNKHNAMSLEEQVQRLSNQIGSIMQQLDQISINTGISSQAGVINLLKNAGLYTANDTRLMNQGKLDLTRLRHYWNHDLSLQAMNTVTQQVERNQHARNRNGYRYR